MSAAVAWANEVVAGMVVIPLIPENIPSVRPHVVLIFTIQLVHQLISPDSDFSRVTKTITMLPRRHSNARQQHTVHHSISKHINVAADE
jgi:hypothetical protein